MKFPFKTPKLLNLFYFSNFNFIKDYLLKNNFLKMLRLEKNFLQ